MSLTITEVEEARDVQGKTRVAYFDVTGDSSYPTAGEAIDFRLFGFRAVYHVICDFGRTTSGTTAVQFSYKPTVANGPVGTLLSYWGNAGTASAIPEVTSTTNISTFTARIKVEGN